MKKFFYGKNKCRKMYLERDKIRLVFEDLKGSVQNVLLQIPT